MADSPKWRWSYGRLGIMWGPMPVGLIFLAVGFAVIYVVYYLE